MTGPSVTPWPGSEPPARDALEQTMRDEGLSPRWWLNGTGHRYAEHEHSYHKVLYCSNGSILFHTSDGDFDLSPGDRLDLPPRTTHSADVGASGVECVEAGDPRAFDAL